MNGVGSYRVSPMTGALRHDAVWGLRNGWIVPCSFGNVGSEVVAATRGVALSDGSARGLLVIEGEDGLDLLHRLSTNHLLGMKDGEERWTIFLDEKGRIVDRVLVMKGAGRLTIMTSQSRDRVVAEWIGKFVIMEDCSVRNITGSSGVLTLTGESVEQIVSFVSDIPVVGNDLVTISGGDMSASGLVERGPRRTAVHLVMDVMSAGRRWVHFQSRGIAAVGWDAWEVLRIAEGVPAAPAELSSAFNPLELGLRNDISFTKGCYIGQEVISRLDAYGKVSRVLVGISVVDGIVKMGSVLLVSGENVGIVTSLARVHGPHTGLAVVKRGVANEGVRCLVEGGEVLIHVLSQDHNENP